MSHNISFTTLYTIYKAFKTKPEPAEKLHIFINAELMESYLLLNLKHCQVNTEDSP